MANTTCYFSSRPGDLSLNTRNLFAYFSPDGSALYCSAAGISCLENCGSRASPKGHVLDVCCYRARVTGIKDGIGAGKRPRNGWVVGDDSEYATGAVEGMGEAGNAVSRDLEYVGRGQYGCIVCAWGCGVVEGSRWLMNVHLSVRLSSALIILVTEIHGVKQRDGDGSSLQFCSSYVCNGKVPVCDQHLAGQIIVSDGYNKGKLASQLSSLKKTPLTRMANASADLRFSVLF